ncbi:Crp/Fnr family transcriptional regulator [Crossiella sp. CA-258035]|uniref:Crp/Fnr family transcriptional regulator n=1 Tax=Crossiella sp. CA-258035 TaxID=2981138 RepID=UPI0024BC063A|nr:Crp/Fnr family transcriptional regulator [Crossiella sp. CA-258035]WHT23401.1 Crp/Fnr family transcriptional regulator [Crossiella sp. CA-258035]
MQDNDQTTFSLSQFQQSVRNSCLLRGLDEEQVELLAAEMMTISVPAGSTIYREGEPADDLYVVAAGKVKISQYLGKKAWQLKDLLGPGEMFGSGIELDRGLRTATATAATGGIVWCIRYSTLDKWTAQEPEIRREMQAEMSRRAMNHRNRRDDQVTLSVAARLAKLFLDMGKRFGTPVGEAISLKHHLSHVELGDLIGASRTAVHGAMAELVRNKLISQRRHGADLLDLQALARLAD